MFNIISILLLHLTNHQALQLIKHKDIKQKSNKKIYFHIFLFIHFYTVKPLLMRNKTIILVHVKNVSIFVFIKLFFITQN